MFGTENNDITCSCSNISNAAYKNKYCIFTKESNEKLAIYNEQNFEENKCESEESFESTTKAPSDVVNDDYIFINNKGDLVSSTSTTTKTVNIVIGFKYGDSSTDFTAIEAPEDGEGVYYLNKYGGGSQVIKVSSDGTYSIVSTDANQAYLEGKDNTNVIICTGINICEIVAASDIQGKFYVNSGDPSKIISYGTALNNDIDITIYPNFIFEMSNNNGLIECFSGTCSVRPVIPRNVLSDTAGIYAAEGYYLGGKYDEVEGNKELVNIIILCSSDYGCSEAYNLDKNKPSSNSDVYFLNAGASKTEEPLIKYTYSDTLDTISGEDTNIYYLNGGDINNKPLIYCFNATLCEEVEVNESYYYVSFDHNLIHYDTDNTWKNDHTITANPGYFLNGGVDKYKHPLRK